jgi:hypothetical protein
MRTEVQGTLGQKELHTSNAYWRVHCGDIWHMPVLPNVLLGVRQGQLAIGVGLPPARSARTGDSS